MTEYDANEDVPEKSNVLDRIRRLSSEGKLSRSELVEAYRQGQKTGTGLATIDEIDAESTTRFSRLLYFTGALVVFLGILLMVLQNWTELSGFSKVLLTLGSGSVTLAAAVGLDYLNRANVLTRSLYYLAGLVLPLGLFVSYQLYGYSPYDPGTVTQVTGLLFVLYATLYWFFDRTVTLAFAIVFGSWWFFGVSDWILVSTGLQTGIRFHYYRTLVIGTFWMILAGRTRGRYVLSMTLWAFGNIAFLSAGFSLGGWEPNKYIFWEIAFPLMVFVILWISVRINSRISLVVSSIFLVTYLTRLTMKYFQDSFGWPLSLVLLGFGIMSIGSVTYLLYDRFLEKKSDQAG